MYCRSQEVGNLDSFPTRRSSDLKGKGKKVGRPYWSLPVARRVVPSEIWYAEPVTYQDVLHSTRSPTWMAVADGETFDRLHPLAAPSDANAVALRFALPSPWKMARVVDVYSLPEIGRASCRERV